MHMLQRGKLIAGALALLAGSSFTQQAQPKVPRVIHAGRLLADGVIESGHW